MSLPVETIAEREQEIIDEFSFFDDWMGRYEHLIEQSKSLPPLDAAYKDESHRIHGCQSHVWVRAEKRNGRIFYSGDSDAHITRGLIALLIRVLSGQPSHEIASAKLDFLEEIGLQEHLSPHRKNGLAGMIQRMKAYAIEGAPAEASATPSPSTDR